MVVEEFLIQHDGDTYDISTFLKNHPGGVNYVEGSRNKNIAEKMIKSKHSKSAWYLLREYRTGGRNDDLVQGNEDLEKLVDWSKPMLSQVGSLGERYNEWVSSPVDRQLRLFDNPFMEKVTITPWYVVPVVWIPTIVYVTHQGVLEYIKLTKDSKPLLPVLLSIVLGVIMWTIIEYSLHRWVFHMEPSGKILISVHFAIHGVHHKVPFDSRRLVFPPVPAALLAYGGYCLVKFVFPECIVLLLTAGGITGYLIYDMIHFYLHYGSPREGTYLYTMKRYHNQHHFVHHNSGFGISSYYWDQVFGTALTLQNLTVGIRWCSDKLKLS